ncbi:MAG: hypothetical protein WBP41_21645 [Saprospiraceae bacterium]
MARKSSFSLIFTSTKSTQSRDEGNTSVEAISAFDFRYFLRKKNSDGTVVDKGKSSVWFQRAIKLMNTFPFSILIGEGGPVYLMNLIWKGNTAIRKHKITHLYSSFRPFTDHFAAYILKKMNPHIYWIADFRDLPFDPYFNKIYFKKIHHRFFHNIFYTADIVTTISDGLAETLKSYNPNVITVKNGITKFPEQFLPVRTLKFTVTYTGSMYLDKKNAEPLFVAIKELIEEGKLAKENVRIVYAGKDSFYWRDMSSTYKLPELIDDRGALSTVEAMKIQNDACVNLLLTISSDQQTGILTGKMIEYFEAGNPVLAIVKNQIDPELETLLKELHIGKSFSDRPSDLQGIKEFIFEEYTHWKKSGMNRKAVDVEVLKKKYSVEETMRPLYEKIGAPALPLNPLK